MPLRRMTRPRGQAHRAYPGVRRPIKPEWLLRQADELAGRTAGVGQPRNADLRRGTSAAYYALYHEMVNRACAHLLPRSGNTQRWRLARLFTHRSLLQVCEWVLGPKAPPLKVRITMLALRSSSRLQDVALAFQTLQQARHEADYDHMADFTRPVTLSLIDQSRDAIRKLELLSSRSPRIYDQFMAHLAMCPAATR